MRLSAWDDELLLISKITAFLAKTLPKLHEPALSNFIPYLLYTCLSLSVFFTILVVPNKQFVNLRLLVGFLGQASKP